jgi:1-phosphofructokinase
MIVTVTLNPAIDKTVEVDHFSVNRVNRIVSSRIDVGGKGINVSKVIASIGGDSRAIGVLAGKAGEHIQQYLNITGIENDFVFVEGETRTNLKIVDPLEHTNTDVNEPGSDIPAEALEKVGNKILTHLNEDTVVIFSGSVPGNVSKDIYKKWIQLAKEKGAKTILDADGDLLAQGIQAGPYLVKPNIHELEKLVGRTIQGIKEAAICASDLMRRYQVEMMVVSLGEQGALVLHQNQRLWVHGIKVIVKSTVGAGDSMVAALAYALDKKYSLEKAVTLAVAAGTANVMTSGTQPSSSADIQELEQRVTWEYLQDY